MTAPDGDFNRHVYFIPEKAIEKEHQLCEERDISAVPGVRSWHQVTSYGTACVAVSLASCFCEGCSTGGMCSNKVPRPFIKKIRIGGMCLLCLIFLLVSKL